MTLRKPKGSKNKIMIIAKDFNRDFDNTEVDTYAFDKVLKSETFANFLCKGFDCKTNDLSLFKEQTSNLVINEVNGIYTKTQRKVTNRAVYYKYIDTMFGKIIQKY
jgi:hypothetical protein